MAEKSEDLKTEEAPEVGHGAVGAVAKKLNKESGDKDDISISDIIDEMLPSVQPHRRVDLKDILSNEFWDLVRVHEEPNLRGDPYIGLAGALACLDICKINRKLMGNTNQRLLEIEFGEQTWVDAFKQEIEKREAKRIK